MSHVKYITLDILYMCFFLNILIYFHHVKVRKEPKTKKLLVYRHFQLVRLSGVYYSFFFIHVCFLDASLVLEKASVIVDINLKLEINVRSIEGCPYPCQHQKDVRVNVFTALLHGFISISNDGMHDLFSRTYGLKSNF